MKKSCGGDGESSSGLESEGRERAGYKRIKRIHYRLVLLAMQLECRRSGRMRMHLIIDPIFCL